LSLDSTVVRLARGANLATVVTVMPDGQPQAQYTQGYCKVDLAVGGVSCLTRARRTGVSEGGDSGPG